MRASITQDDGQLILSERRFRVYVQAVGFNLRVQVSLWEGRESPRESPWVSLGSQRSFLLRFPKVLGPSGFKDFC